MAESLKSLKNKEYINRRTVKGMEHSLREYIEFLDEKNLVIDYHLEEGFPEIKVKNISYNFKRYKIKYGCSCVEIL